MNNSFNFIAHVKEDSGSQTGWKEHLLEEHLKEVAKLSSGFAESFQASEWAYLAGLWHDLGKYSNDFQKKIHVKSEYKPELKNLQCIGSEDSQHAITGAIHYINKFEELIAKCSPQGKKDFDFLKHLISHAIAGHHGGLPNWGEGNDKRNLNERIYKKEFLEKVSRNQSLNRNLDEILNTELPHKKCPNPERKDISLLIRMIFSCLVDADFLDTEKFFDSEKPLQRKHNLDFKVLAERFDEHISQFDNPSTEIDKLRCKVLEICKQNAIEKDNQIFSLTVPTGGGKTLSSMAFALSHAIQFNKRKIIYVIPYTSIIEQNAKVFKKAFGSEEAVLEHHSNFDFESNSEKENDKEQYQYNAKLATENWDHPIIVTTTVQFFESLFGNKPSSSRKLHNISNSVVVIDEVQLLPIDYLNPIFSYIQELQKNYNVTFVLSTATQPPFEGFNNYHGLKNVEEIIPRYFLKELFNKLEKRISLYLPENLEQKPEDFNLLSQEIISHNDSVLCIVNTKKAAFDLFRRVKEQLQNLDLEKEYKLFHLSTNMCAAHRLDKLNEIREILESKKQKIIVISTQLVEAGVDLDFPIVYRATAGLASIAQAGGRCNREGKLEAGKLFVFQMPSKYKNPDKSLKRAEANGLQILRKYQKQSLEFERFPEFFKNYFHDEDKGLDANSICELNGNYSFRTVSERFKIIDDNTVSVVVPYLEKGHELIQEIEKLEKPDFRILRRAQPFVVSLYKNKFEELRSQKIVESKFDQIHYIPSASSNSNIAYDLEFGLNLSGDYEVGSFIR